MTKPVFTKHQPSITEWFASIGKLDESKAFRKEDNEKANRLEILYQEIGLPYERPKKLPACELTDKAPRFAKILEERGDELCAIRLVPGRPGLPKLRLRGLSIRECYESWFKKQEINPDDYTAHICPHSETLLWSTIFVINNEAIFGEIIEGLHSQLTHGDTKNPLYQFRYDFKDWQWSEKDSEAAKQIKDITNLLLVTNKDKQKKLKKRLNAKFSHNYLTGYFEAVVWPDKKIYFIDYNRFLLKHIPTPPSLVVSPKEKRDDVLHGVTAYPGIVQGRVVKVKPQMLDKIDFPKDAILVCDNTDVRYLSLMRKAAAIVTNRGGILSHPAIISRELKKPCVIGTKIATQVLKDNNLVKVDAEKGTVKII